MPKKEDKLTRRLPRYPTGQKAMFDKSYEEEQEERQSQPVECLGLTFPNDEARRAHFLGLLREQLGDPEFRRIEGFPIGSDEDILALSDPPYYTACPNPFIEEFIRCYGKPYDPATDHYHREPFAADVSEGKNDPIYNAHSYHTKVPHKAIMRYILHYTEPGDMVFDGFCGTGMTGVAAQLCGDKTAVESLGYEVDGDGTISQQDVDQNGNAVWRPFSKLGPRRAVLNDLSPAATFIAYNYNTPFDMKAFERESRRLLEQVEKKFGWMYQTDASQSVKTCRVNYVVWSDVFLCPYCSHDVVFFDVAVDHDTGGVKDIFRCERCDADLRKSDLDRKKVVRTHPQSGEPFLTAVQTPALVNYGQGSARHTKKPSQWDFALLDRIENTEIPYFYPVDRIDRDIDVWYERDYRSLGLNSLDSFFTRRNLCWLAALFNGIEQCPDDVRCPLLFTFTGTVQIASRMSSFRYDSRNPKNTAGGILKGALYIPSLSKEADVTDLFWRRQRAIRRMQEGIRSFGRGGTYISTSSSTCVPYPDNSMDYLFFDPPFGSNIIYSELSLVWESWLRVYTQDDKEAVVHRRRKSGKKIGDYALLMRACLSEAYRTLKPGHWLTVEFSNTKAAVWNAIQIALQEAGFVVANVAALDKQGGSFRAVTTPTAVRQDLVISAYKPNGGLEHRFRIEAGTEEGAWDFVRTHLRQLPVFVAKEGRAEVIAERQNYLLFDRMVAFHVQRGITVPLSASEFYAGLAQRFPERDGMYFLPEQAAEYDRQRMTVREVLQLQLIVTDEASAVQWLKQQLVAKPQTFQELHPQFLREIGGWSKNEVPLELSTLLEQSFIRYDAAGEVPSQVHSYLSSNFKELRNLPKDDPALRAKAKDRWYVPDPNKAGDLEKLRERALLREFEDYVASTQRRLRVFRLEAVRAGFKRAWQARDYGTIIAVAEKIPERVLQEDPKLLMWYDQAVTRSGGEGSGD